MKEINLKSLSALFQVPVVVTGAGEEDWDQGMGTSQGLLHGHPPLPMQLQAVRDSLKRNPAVFPHTGFGVILLCVSLL